MGWIDLNADLGEGGDYDAGLMKLVSSCNIACGGHVGDEASMEKALRLAKQNAIAAGAHPSFPDREGFGRQPISISLNDLETSLEWQIKSLIDVAKDVGVALLHLKPHGALYNLAATKAEMGGLIADVTARFLPSARLVGPPNSQLEDAAARAGIGFLGEGFADRAYGKDGQLIARTQPGAVLETDAARCAQAIEIAMFGQVTSVDGTKIPMPTSTLCIHGDTPGALSSARLIRRSLQSRGIIVRAPM